MRKARQLISATIGMVCLLLQSSAAAQGGQATLFGRALLPASTQVDGPRSGAALAARQTINGIKVPFDNQPVGNISAVLATGYPDIWLGLSSGTFDSRERSSDFLLRIYTFQVNLRTKNGGDGTVSVLDWKTLSDPQKKLANVKNTNTRELTGQDFDPQALYQAKDGSFWIAESYGPSLLHFDADGKLLEAPIALSGAGELQAMSGMLGGATLFIAQRAMGVSPLAISVRILDLKSRAFQTEGFSYNLDNGQIRVSAMFVVKNQQTLVIEQDTAENRNTRFKRVFLIDFDARPVQKTLVADLLKVSDPDQISMGGAVTQPSNAFGIGTTFLFPYRDVSAIYPVDADKLLVVNNNHVPFGQGRSTSQADDTDFVVIQLAQPLALDPGFRTSR
jgi:hypothetical protein